MNDIQRIDEVIFELDKIIDECIRQNSRKGYFACLYRKMTIAVKQGILNNQFEDGARMEQLDIIFAQRYLKAYRQYQNRQICTVSWDTAFKAADQQHTTLQHLLLGMNAHINLDLGIAAAQVSKDRDIQALKTDFDRINEVIGSLINEVQQDIEDICWPMRWVKLVNNQHKDAVINFSISLARKSAWANALVLASSPDSLWDHYISNIDQQVSQIGLRVITPSISQSILLRGIRLFEPNDITQIIASLKD